MKVLILFLFGVFIPIALSKSLNEKSDLGKDINERATETYHQNVNKSGDSVQNTDGRQHEMNKEFDKKGLTQNQTEASSEYYDYYDEKVGVSSHEKPGNSSYKGNQNETSVEGPEMESYCNLFGFLKGHFRKDNSVGENFFSEHGSGRRRRYRRRHGGHRRRHNPLDKIIGEVGNAFNEVSRFVE